MTSPLAEGRGSSKNLLPPAVILGFKSFQLDPRVALRPKGDGLVWLYSIVIIQT